MTAAEAARGITTVAAATTAMTTPHASETSWRGPRMWRVYTRPPGLRPFDSLRYRGFANQITYGEADDARS